MYKIGNGFIEFVASILIFVSMKIHLDFWLAASFGIALALFGIYSGTQKRIVTTAVELVSGSVLLLHIINVGHPIVSIPAGVLLFILSITKILPGLLE